MGPGLPLAAVLAPGADLVAGREDAVAAGDDAAGEQIFWNRRGDNLAPE